MTPGKTTGPTGEGPAADRRGNAYRESTALGPVQQWCAAGLGLSIEAGLLARAAAAGRPLDPVQVERIVYGQCAADRPLGEVER